MLPSATEVATEGHATELDTKMNQANRVSIVAMTIAAIVVVLDVIVKWLSMHWVGPAAGTRERWLIDGWLGLTYVENSGVAFGLLRGSSTLVLTLATLIAIAGIGLFVWTNRSRTAVLIAGGLIVGGAIGNVIDRVRLGYVVDFIEVYIGSYQWPTFNVADAAIRAGAALLALDIILEGREEGRMRQAAAGNN